MVPGHVPPEVELQRVLLLELHRVLEGEEDGEPGEHPRGVGGGQDGDLDALVEVTLEVSSEPVEDGVCGDVEAELGVSRVVDNFCEVWVLECEQSLGRRQLESILKHSWFKYITYNVFAAKSTWKCTT